MSTTTATIAAGRTFSHPVQGACVITSATAKLVRYTYGGGAEELVYSVSKRAAFEALVEAGVLVLGDEVAVPALVCSECGRQVSEVNLTGGELRAYMMRWRAGHGQRGCAGVLSLDYSAAIAVEAPAVEVGGAATVAPVGDVVLFHVEPVLFF